MKQFHVTLYLRGYESTAVPYVIQSECATYYNVAEAAVNLNGGSQVHYATVSITTHKRPMCPESQSGIALSSYISECCDCYASEFLKYLNTFSSIVTWGVQGGRRSVPLIRRPEMRDNKDVSKGRSKSSRRTKAKSISLSATSLCRKYRTRALGGDRTMATPFDKMLWDVSKFRSPANCMPRRAVVRSPSEESEHDTLVERGSMVEKQGVSLALDPTQFIFIKFTNMLSFWFPFQQDDPVRRIDVYADKWNTDRAFDCVFLPPIYRDATRTVCYNGGSVQTFHLILKDLKLVALKTTAGHQSDAMPPKNTFETMAEVFLAYVQSAALFDAV